MGKAAALRVIYRSEPLGLCPKAPRRRQKVAAAMTTFTKAPPLPETPYRGIESFRYIDQQIFSARDDEAWDLLSNILIHRGVLLYGDSGSGKSSLINAGLIPAALKENLIANRLRVQPRRSKEFKIERIPTESDDKPPYLPSLFIE